MKIFLIILCSKVVGDQVYGGRFRLVKGGENGLNELMRNFGRQALHATRLGLEHPETGEYIEWEVPIPADFQALLDFLRAH